MRSLNQIARTFCQLNVCYTPSFRHSTVDLYVLGAQSTDSLLICARAGVYRHIASMVVRKLSYGGNMPSLRGRFSSRPTTALASRTTASSDPASGPTPSEEDTSAANAFTSESWAVVGTVHEAKATVRFKSDAPPDASHSTAGWASSAIDPVQIMHSFEVR